MNWISGLSVRARLIASFVFVAILAGVIGAVGLSSIMRLHGMASHMYDFDMQGIHQVGRVDAELRSVATELRTALLFPKGRAQDDAVQKLQGHLQALRAAVSSTDQFFVTAEGRNQYQRLQASVREYEAGVSKVMEQLDREYFPGATSRDLAVLQKEAQPKAMEVQGIVAGMLEAKLNNAQRFKSEMGAVERNTVIAVAALTAAGVIIAVLLGLLLARISSRQLGGEPSEVASIAAAIAQGDLTADLNSEDLPPNSVMANMAAMQASLRRLVGSVLSSSNSIASGASQIAAGNTDLSQRTEEQAANLTQTASAMEELSGTVQSNADVARQAAQRAMAASRSAENGGEVVGNVVQTMAGITESSKRIVDIISVIDSIAFQTNILALNAAVEAARAGEQGRGFAVVASEVRSLAQKSASAAKDIKQLIDDSVQKVDDGSKLVDLAGETMAGIVSDVKQVTDLISEISAATTEQTSGISQVNDAVLQLSDVTQQNAALVQQSAAASASLNDQAKQLVELVKVFRLGASQGASGQAQSGVISVPPATIEDGVRRERPAPSGYRGHGSAGPSARSAAASAASEAAASAPAETKRPAAPALGGYKPTLATAGATAAAGQSLYGSGVSKEDDWEEF